MTTGTIHHVISLKGGSELFAHDGDEPIATVHSGERDAERLAACWNFCTGLSTESLLIAKRAQDAQGSKP